MHAHGIVITLYQVNLVTMQAALSHMGLSEHFPVGNALSRLSHCGLGFDKLCFFVGPLFFLNILKKSAYYSSSVNLLFNKCKNIS